MRVTFYGVRGSLPVPGPATARYGGNTPCVAVRSDSGQTLILDAGTGIRELGLALMAQGPPFRVTLLISHTHWDHIHGFPFFVPAYVPGNRIDVYGPAHFDIDRGKTLASIFDLQMDYAYFPISTAQLGAELTFATLPDGPTTIGDFTVVPHAVNHPVLAYGYRISADGRTVVYTGDHEPYYDSIYANVDPGDLDDDELDDYELAQEAVEEGNRQAEEFVAGADLLIADCQYTDEEYPTRVGWGHSHVSYVKQLALAGRVRRLALFHHEPARTDDALEALEREVRESLHRDSGGSLEAFAAAEGMEIRL